MEPDLVAHRHWCHRFAGLPCNCEGYKSSAEEAREVRDARQPEMFPEPTPVSGEKPSNPKDIIGSTKLPLSLWPSTATAMGSLGMLEGCLKYGRDNFRAIGVRASIYVDACKRHLDAWMEGEEVSPDYGVPHLANALSCLAILVDAQAAGKLTDDRKIAGGYRELVEELTPHVARLQALLSDKHPRHYTIADNPEGK